MFLYHTNVSFSLKRPGANGHDVKLGVKGQGAGLVGKTMLPGLWGEGRTLPQAQLPLALPEAHPQAAFKKRGGREERGEEKP